jgi:hypothetical protein
MVQLLRLPGLPPRGDVSDWRKAGHTREELLALVKCTTPWTAAEDSPPPPAGKPSPWDQAQSVADFVNSTEPEALWLYAPLLSPGSITEIFAPRGLGKTHVAYAVAVELERAGKRVLLLDRDNSKREVKRRLRAWGGGTADRARFKVMGRDEVPPLTDTAAWAQFPYQAYDLVIIDSLDASTEGVGEQDSGKPSKAIAPILDIAHRADGPAILILGNTIKSGAHARGSGVVEDRADISYEVRDATNFTPTGTKPWHEELPPAGVETWASRATRRKQRDRYRLAFVSSKFRLGEEPAPFVLELRLPKDGPWTLHDVTQALLGEGEAAAIAAVKAHADKIAAAAEALEGEIRARARAGDAPLAMEGAVAFLKDMQITRKSARELIRDGTGQRWRVETLKNQAGQPKVLLPTDLEGGDKGAAKIPASEESPVFTGSREGDVSATRMNSGQRKHDPRNTWPVAGIPAEGLFPPRGSTTTPNPNQSRPAETPQDPDDVEVV